jgi:NTE family protein
MAETRTKTAIAFQGGGALGAYAFGALKHIYATEPKFRPSCVSGVSIGAFTAAIVASHPTDPIPKIQAFWDDLTVLHSAFMPPSVEKFLAYSATAPSIGRGLIISGCRSGRTSTI